jgi:thioredoxin-like negative regulator of GroEL
MTKKATALPSRVAAKVGTLCDLADAAFVEGRVMEAAERYVSAWKLLPEPREQWESGREIVKCVAEACLVAGDIAAAKEALAHARKHKGADDDETLAALVKRVNAFEGRSPAKAPKKAKAPPGRRRPPSRPASSSPPKARLPKTAKRAPGKKTGARRRRRPS